MRRPSPTFLLCSFTNLLRERARRRVDDEKRGGYGPRGVRMPQASSIEWVRSGTGMSEPLVATPSPLLSSAGMWTGIRLAATAIDHGGELPEGYANAPLVHVCLDELVSEACHAGKWMRRRFEPGDITISPPGMPIAYRWNGPNRGILVELDLDALPAPIEIKPLFAGKDPLITHLALALRDELYAGNPGGRIYG